MSLIFLFFDPPGLLSNNGAIRGRGSSSIQSLIGARADRFRKRSIVSRFGEPASSITHFLGHNSTMISSSLLQLTVSFFSSLSTSSRCPQFDTVIQDSGICLEILCLSLMVQMMIQKYTYFEIQLLIYVFLAFQSEFTAALARHRDHPFLTLANFHNS